jgi:hypothetical protein
VRCSKRLSGGGASSEPYAESSLTPRNKVRPREHWRTRNHLLRVEHCVWFYQIVFTAEMDAAQGELDHGGILKASVLMNDGDHKPVRKKRPSKAI